MRVWILLLLTLASRQVLAATTSAEIARAQAFAHERFPGKSWDNGPVELANEAIRAAYPGLRFFVVWSNEPLPPGAPSPPDVHPTWGERMQEFHATHVLAAVVALSPKGTMRLHDDVNSGLKRVRTEKEALHACAAVLSLMSGTRAPPGLVALSEVSVQRTGGGWSCSMQQRWIAGNATFNAKGKCERATKTSHAPMPPSAPPRPTMP